MDDRAKYISKDGRSFDRCAYETDHMADNPSLKSQIREAVEWAYGNALVMVETETGLPETTFPAVCGYAFGQMMDEGFWPE